MSCNVLTTEIKFKLHQQHDPKNCVFDNLCLLQKKKKSRNRKAERKKDLRRGASTLAMLVIMAGIDDLASGGKENGKCIKLACFILSEFIEKI